MNKKLVLFSLFLVLCFTVANASENAAAFAYLDKNQAYIGDKISLTVLLRFSDNISQVDFKPEDKLKKFEIKEVRKSKPVRKYIIFGKYSQRYEYVFSVFEAGNYTIEPITVKFAAKDGSKIEVQTSGLNLEIESILDKESASDIRDIKLPVSLRRGILFYLYIVLIPCLFLAGYIIYRKRAIKSMPGSAFLNMEDPYSKAMDAIFALETGDLLKRGAVKEFYLILTRIVRGYLTEVFNVNIIDMTTSETVRELKTAGIVKKDLSLCRDFFVFADLVKFAKHIPSDSDISSSLEEAKEIIQLGHVDSCPPQIPVKNFQENK